MSQTINAIQERLSPDHLVTETKDAIKDATVERAKQVAQGASRVADIARDSFENPGRVAGESQVESWGCPVSGGGYRQTQAMWLAIRALRRPRAAHKVDRLLRNEEERTTRRRRSGIGRVLELERVYDRTPIASRCRHRHGLLGDVEGPTPGVRQRHHCTSPGRDRRTTGRVT